MAKETAQAPKAGARPGAKEPKAKKEKKVRIAYPVPEGGLEAVPADFDPKVHKPLGRKNFKNEAVWYELKAQELEKKAASLRVEATNIGKLGNVKDRAKAKRLLDLQKRMAELSESLVAEGVDVEALLATLG